MSEVINRVNFLVNMGFIVTPLVGKKPILKGWQNITLEKSRTITINALNGGSANNFGVLTGKVSGIVVIDIDKRENGIANWLELIKDKKMKETLVVGTGSGGYHIYYKYDPRLSSCRKITGWGIDFKSDGGQVVAPGSVHPDTKRLYIINYGYKDEIITLATFPEFLVPFFTN